MIRFFQLTGKNKKFTGTLINGLFLRGAIYLKININPQKKKNYP